MRGMPVCAAALAFAEVVSGLAACSSANSSRSNGEAGMSGSAGETTMAGMGAAGGRSSAMGTGGSTRSSSSTGGSGAAGMKAATAGSGGRATNGTGGTNAGSSGTGGASGSGGNPANTNAAGWLYTKGNKIYVTGDDAKPWIGRGVNVDDLMFCGYNGNLWMSTPGDTFKQMIATVIENWKPTFLRISLGMASYNTVSWLMDPAPYKMPMMDAIKSVGDHPGVYVLVTVRSDKSMIGQWSGGPEATGMPSDAQTTPDKNAYPTGTDAVYKQLVDDFKDDAFVLFSLSNEPGGNAQSNSTLRAAMEHAVGVIRDEEDRLGANHHIVSVQGNSWTSDIGFYDASPISEDNVVYEIHGYPPATQSYTYANLPVIIGEYGSLSNGGTAFFADIEQKAIPSLAWDYQPFSDCMPDLLTVTHSATDIEPTDSGKIVQAYLMAHAQ